MNTCRSKENVVRTIKQDISYKFEGPEKKLEIIIENPEHDLRKTDSASWHRLAAAGGARIIGQISNERMVAYLLAESSLFIWRDRVLMITCGRTQLVNAFPEFFNIINKSEVALVVYQRKNSLYPGEQPSDFETDVSRLEKYFPGKSYRLGPANDDHVHVFYSSGKALPPHANISTTFQMQMGELDHRMSRIFSHDYAITPQEAEKLSGIDKLFPRMQKQGYLFTPYGYSLNAIDQEKYMTIHVTPQPRGSYASFETNIFMKDFEPLISDNLSIFAPGKFSILLTTSPENKALSPYKTIKKTPGGYHTTEKSHYKFESGYTLTFLNFVKAISFQ